MFGTSIPIHVIDFEGAPAYGVVEYGVATLIGGEIAEVQTRLCAAYAPIDPHDVAVHGITYEESLRHKPFDDDFDYFSNLRRRGVLAAHNARYEAKLIKKCWATPGMVPEWSAYAKSFCTPERVLAAAADVPAPVEQSALWGPWVDSLVLARKLAPGLPRYKLACVVEDLGLQNSLDAHAINFCPANRRMYHAALYDAIASALILKKLLLDAPIDIDERILCVKD